MPRRRPPGEGPVVNNIFLLAAAVLFLPWLVNAQQQQRPGSGIRQRQESPHESLEASPLHTVEATKIHPQQVETPLIAQRRKNTISVNDRDINNDASAIATLAPAGSAVAAPSIKRPNTSSVGLSPPQDARSLKDWDVEDFVLLATVDGTLHARERKKGVKKWDLKLGGLEPMVQTTYYRRNRSSVEEDFETIPIDNYLWAIEPSRDGSIYIYQPSGPSPGLVNTGLTMKKLVDVMSPHWTEDPPVMYSGEKKTTMMTVDAETGLVIGHFSPTGAYVNQDVGRDNCKNTGFPSDECASNQVLTIGRTEYTVGIQGTKDGHQIATLRFFEWTPNSYDHDLSRQYHETKDQKYIYAKHDGLVIGFHHDTLDEHPRALFREKFDSPVVRVFDVGRHYTLQNSNPSLMILPQPLPPDLDESIAEQRAGSIFLNHTEDGSWYAMSGKSYPLVDLQKPREAQCMNQEWRNRPHIWDIMNSARLSEALVGLHSIDGQSSQMPLRTISPPSTIDTPTEPDLQDRAPALAVPPSVIRKLQSLPQMVFESLLDFIKNPFWMIIGLSMMIFYRAQIKQHIHLTAGRLFEEKQIPSFIKDAAERAGLANLPTVQARTVPIDGTPVPPIVDVVKADADEAGAPVVEIVVKKDVVVVPAPVLAPVPAPTDEVAVVSPEKKKKRTHRGQRGGVKHKKGHKPPSPEASQILERSQDGNPPKSQPTVDDAVRNAQNMGQQTNLEPDIRTVPNDPAEVSGPILRVGALECDTEQLIGTGSNGTMVFRGKFDGRDVAVKRMLIQFFDIASQETKLLRESDDHPNVIRYFAQQQAAGFLYIALELCPASLSDVIEKPHLHRDLAQGGEQDLPGVLYQITNGLQHLHNLRIVHRDLKPQNILVSMGKDGTPRLLVSDFGLCKKLEGEQSSFRATTAHAAGTSGWRAPELLLDDDAKDGLSMVDASTEGNSGPLLSSDLMPNRRATRAIDIFSLGLVFYYVLTKGSHPFDCGDKYMREVNIRKANFDLTTLLSYGDYGMEATDLISSMLSAEPKLRPTARHVMAHPFFWSPKKRLNFLCDVSDHFEKEKRDPPTAALVELERYALQTTRGDFLKPLGKEFVESMGKQRKYTGSRLLDLLRALRNKRNHYEDMSDKLKKEVGPLPEGYLSYWTTKFPDLLINCWSLVYYLEWNELDRFREYYTPARL